MQFISHEKKYNKYHKIYYKSNRKFLSKQKYINKNVWYIIASNIMLQSLHLKMIIQLIKQIIKPYKKNVIIKLKIFPDFNKTQKPRDIRMGRGKGEIFTRVAFCRGSSFLIELLYNQNIYNEFSEQIFYQCSQKLGIFSYFVSAYSKWLK